uniref:DNA 3'-5' helicase n=1 Tax=Culicoides sonorensis TaxID=179676 RepID=A0A336LR96_CULSO
MDDEKYKQCKLTIKRWEKEFKLKYGRIPSKHDFREADKLIQHAYRTYCRLKTALLEETLRDVLNEDDTFDDDSFGLNISQVVDGESFAPFELPQIPVSAPTVYEDQVKKVFEPEIEVDQSKVWTSELNKKTVKNKKEETKKETSEPVIKLNVRKSFTMRNPRKPFNRSMSTTSSNGSFSLSQGNDFIPDLETILLEKAKRHDIENVPKNANLPSKNKELVNNVDVGWLNRRDPSNKVTSENQAPSSNFGLGNAPVAILSQQGATSFGMSSLKINSGGLKPHTQHEEAKFNKSDDSDAAVSNSDEESTIRYSQRRSVRHVMKRRRLNESSSQIQEPKDIEPTVAQTVNAEISPEPQKIVKPEVLELQSPKIKTPAKEKIQRTPAKEKVQRTPTRRSTRTKKSEIAYQQVIPESDEEIEVDPFACDDDSDKDPEFKDVSQEKETKTKNKREVKKKEDKKESSVKVKKIKEKVKKAITTVKNVAKTRSSRRSTTKKTEKAPESQEPLTEEQSLNESKEFNDYVLEFGIEHTETVPRIDPATLKQTTNIFEEFICSEASNNMMTSETSGSTSVNKMKVSAARSKLEKKIAAGSLNENFVRLNMKKKVFVRGKKTFNFSRHKKSLWKKKKAAALAGPEMDMGGCDGGVLTCYNCGNTGHMARQCKIKGDGLLPITGENEEEPSPYPTLEEAEKMTANQRLLAHSRNPSALPKAGNLKIDGDSEQLEEQMDYEDIDFGSDFEEDELPEEAPKPHKIIPEDFLKMCESVETTAGKDQIPPMYQNEIETPAEVFDALKQFGHQSFRPGQEKAIMRILSGKSTLLTLSTGSGKSLCYQLPAFLYKKHYKRCITLVISPLVSLMEDQVHGIPSFLNAQCLHTNQSEKQRDKIMEMVKDNTLDVLLVSPEAVVAGEKATGFGALLRQLPSIAFACIDEAHCVSQWSHNFRPSYLMICQVLKEKLKVNTILGLTATATKSTRESIITHLGIPDGENGIISDIPLPENLFLTISKDKQKDIGLIELIKSERFKSCNSIIVYCTRREECERVASFVRTSLQDTFVPPESTKRKRVNWIAEPYHAGMAASRRRTIQKAFMSGELRIVVATVAFGMGINKPDIRAVIHYNMPRSFESYVQEVGRAGRDGLPAQCHLFLDGRGNDRNELRRHIYANSIDRHVIRKLLQKVFVPCACKSKCPGHEVSFPVEATVQMLDIPEENVATLLCYLELHEQRYVHVLSRAYTRCKVLSYGGATSLKQAAQKCPPLAMAIALDMKNGINHETTTTIEFGVIDVAAAIGWDSGVVKYQLKQLEWTQVNGKSKRSNISVQFSELGFRVRAPGDLQDDELDKTLDLLHDRVSSQEKMELLQLQATFEALQSVAFNSYIPATQVNCPSEPSDKLKKIIRTYFQSDALPNLDSITTDDDSDTPDEILINDIRTMIQRYPENNFTGRALARIFHGVSSPNYPAVIWGRCKYWRVHMNVDFTRIVMLANAEIVRNRL